jgi:hypothetical protein
MTETKSLFPWRFLISFLRSLLFLNTPSTCFFFTLINYLFFQLLDIARAGRVQSSRFRILLFKALQTDNADDRAVALERIIEVTKSYIHAAYPPNSPSKASTTSTDTSAPNTPNPGQPEFNGYLYERKNRSFQTNEEDPVRVSESESNITSDPETEEAVEQLHNYLLTLLRLSITCPFRDVRKTFKDFLRKLQVCGTLMTTPLI